MARQVLWWTAVGAIIAVALVAVAYMLDMHGAYERIRSNGSVVSSIFGDIEFTETGSGHPVLVIHGSGGGYDQGELIAKAVLGDDFRQITPSRFGYLRSSLREGASWDDQAHAYAFLLDHLGIDEVAVVAMSQGGPSALLFAALHPERVSSLSLISCGVSASASPEQAEANEKGDMLTTIFKHDVLYWAVSKMFRKQLLRLLGADDTTIAGLTAEQRRLFDDFVDYMNPAAPRSAGVIFDNKAKMPGDRIAAITAPTIIVHAADDTLQLFHNAEFAATRIPNAKLVRYERGGHLLIGTEQFTIRTMVKEHILDIAGE